jgi:5'-nucleotidase
MSQIGYDAGIVGNHEFDNGLEGIASALPFARFPILSSNYDFSDTILSGLVSNYKIIKKGGIKIGIYSLGIELDGLVGKLNFGNTRYLDPLATALQMERLLKLEHSCDLVICLSHLGFAYEHSKISDCGLAPQTLFTDLVIGGHTHSFLEKPLELKNKSGKLILVNQAGWASLVAGKIEFLFDRTGKRKTFSAVVNNL